MERALTFEDEVSAELIAYYDRKRRMETAKLAVGGPKAMAAVMNNEEEKGQVRVSAADTLMRWAEPETAGQIGAQGASIQVDAHFERALEKVYGEGEGGGES